MRGPDDEFRHEVHERASASQTEDDIEELLADIERRLSQDLEENPHAETPLDELAAVDSWAAVASHAVARYHAPASPWPRSVAGWGQRAAKRLRRIANLLSTALQNIKTALGAASYSIAVNFPWGISISLSW